MSDISVLDTPDCSSCRFLCPVVVCLVLMGMVWFGLAALQTRLAGMAVSDNTEEEALNRWQGEGFTELGLKLVFPD